jgi:hypothetical protein
VNYAGTDIRLYVNYFVDARVNGRLERTNGPLRRNVSNPASRCDNPLCH